MSFLLTNPFAQKMHRAPTNPMDKSTVVSIYPKKIREVKYTIEPGIFEIPPGSFDSPSVLVVGSSSWWKNMFDQEPSLEIVNSSIQVANSIVVDYCNGILGCNMGDSMPGLFYLLGEHTAKDVKTKPEFLGQLVAAKAKQDKWMATLVKMADVLWARHQGNPLVISDDMKMAAELLNMKDKPWMKDFTMMKMTNCPACGSMVNPSFPICGNCKTIINQEEYKKMNLKQAV